ncbi:protein of unknown function DUF1295 [Parvibaculum lavamentivorans DS-1]|uniref:Uncharacterized protein n=1 Tax=Parvibaculum lavamentivorans (strain DS-1 / DSM 13023 / NCIMB 13966) TaxID=402881 RepID=A7HX76_PARL1|nr:DUF1295 domain-containing protein [Parvibaculum lavamentivorans]ABS64509.1 protein of unknown function DUF1295 [Parvibaculum lavamentivorans DS-1]
MSGEIATLMLNAGFVLAAMLVVWVLSVILRDAGIVDIFWGLGFVIIALATWSLNPGYSTRAALIAGLTALWGLRLAGHLYLRWRREASEDRRYAAMRAKRGPSFWWKSLYIVFGLQAAIMFAVSLPVQFGIMAETPGRLTLADVLGTVLVLTGLAFEAIGDAQLTAFKADPANRGKVMDRGLWAWTRHPNYFGDAVVWWGLFIIAASSPALWWTAIGPALMTWFLVNVSGKALLERGLRKSRPGYDDYVWRTSGFIPLPPRRRD